VAEFIGHEFHAWVNALEEGVVSGADLSQSGIASDRPSIGQTCPDEAWQENSKRKNRRANFEARKTGSLCYSIRTHQVAAMGL